jgi:ABC-type multidrug transport system fused ATPase/permease subunit
VAFMQHSKITAVGTHESLLQDSEAYRQVVMRTLDDVDV